ncbi:unnamed protein product [Strongylus vulgaris]|uniref:EF-hand domain-containing protein n=1 Tax=Strongylus vulgaris TaxID=40348 RepID=A0A3P7IZ60_STRVU|nr:unnamed protein product [Strongylus vulgaris]
MCLMYLSASNGEPNEMVGKTLELGIHLLSGGNVDIQRLLIEYLQLKKDVRFFTSMAGLMNKCSVLNLEMFERQIKAEGLGMGAELASGDNQNLNDAEFTCSLFRFLQLTCEGHNLEFQNYLRTQPGHTTSVNLINCTVDYLLRLQESVMDFYWHYSSKEVIDEGGKEYFLRAIQVCSQVFNTLTESIQGPCVGNQMTLANSRLWDAINGFFFLFAHMMEKLYRNSTQLELLREFLNLQKDMIVLMLSMLEGNVLNGPIGKQMVDALVESQPSVEKILKFSDMFLKLKDLTTSQAFQDFDTNRDGWISPKEFQRAMESQKMYTVEDITYLMMCTDVNNDGKVDYMEFTERFHNPARDIGFNLAVLLTNLKEHITNDPRLEKIIEKAQTLLEYFDPFLGRIEIMGSSKRVEKIYFEIQESWLEQWGKQQIRDSKNSFLFNVLQDDGGDQGKLEAFINFCEDTIFEMQHAAEISAGDSDSKVERALKQRDYFLQQTSTREQISETFKSGYHYGLTAASALRPENVKQTFKGISAKVKQMTWLQLLWAIAVLTFQIGKALGYGVYLLLMTLFRFAYYLTTPEREDEMHKDEPMELHTPIYGHPILPEFHRTHIGLEAFGLAAEQLPTGNGLHQDIPRIITEDLTTSDEPTSTTSPTSPTSHPPSPHGSVHKSPRLHTPIYGHPILPEFHRTHIGLEAFGLAAEQLPTGNGLHQDIPRIITEDLTTSDEPTSTTSPTSPTSHPPSPHGSVHKAPRLVGISCIGQGEASTMRSGFSLYESIGAPPLAAAVSEVDLTATGAYEPKIAEQNIGRTRGSILNMLARNFKPIEKTTLYLAFFINVILLFHRVDIRHVDTSGWWRSVSEFMFFFDLHFLILNFLLKYFAGRITIMTEGVEVEEDDDTVETVYISGMMIPYIDYEITGWVLAQVNHVSPILRVFL